MWKRSRAPPSSQSIQGVDVKKTGRRNWPWTEGQRRTLRQIKIWRRASKTGNRVSWKEIARRLNAKGWPGPGGEWTAQAVARQAEKDDISPPKRVRKKRLEADEYLTYEQVKACKRVCPPRDKLILDFLLVTGLRPGCEFAKLQNRDLEFTFKGPVIHIRHGKGDKERFVTISKAMSVRLRTVGPNDSFLSDASAPMFLDTKGNAVSARALRDRLSKLGRKAGLKILTPTRIRHSFGTLLYDNGNDLLNIADQMGHADVNTSRIYVTVLDNAASKQAVALQKRLDSLDPVQELAQTDTNGSKCPNHGLLCDLGQKGKSAK